MGLKQKYIFLVAIAAFFLLLIPPRISLADYCSSTCPEYYSTECQEQVNIGCCSTICCAICCGEGGCWCCGWCKSCSCSGEWDEYKCSSPNCDKDILIRHCHSYKAGGPCQMGSCADESCCVSCTSWETCEECGSWQKPERSCACTKEGLVKPECKCNKDCIDKPTNPRYYDNPNYPTDTCNPETGKNPNSIYLPVKLDWGDVRGWKDGWREGSTCPKTCSASCPNCPSLAECYKMPECVHSYVIKITQKAVIVGGKTIEPETVMVNEEVLDKSEYNIREKKGFCFLKPNHTYEWQVRACCGADGTNCGSWSDVWTFITNPAPEPKLPLDPDWNGSGKAEDLPLIDKLEWCNIEDEAFYPGRMGYDNKWHYVPLSYKFFLYYADYDETDRTKYKCYPELWDEKEQKCNPLILEPNERLGELWPPPEFPNDEYGWLTKLHSYTWKVAACKDISATDCTDWSQEWILSIGEFHLEPPRLTGPPNDEEIPIGLPVLLQWEGASGTQSYIYEINGAQDKTRLPNVSFDYPQLALNTPYSWKVQPCWDFDSLNCETNVWSETYHFITTGRPPELSTMKPSGPDVPIPAIFEWENVPGAKSYVFKFQGVEKPPVEEPRFPSLGYPDLKQEANYSWQVKTCAWTSGRACGEYSNPQSFRTFKLGTPSSPKPGDGGQFYTYEKTYRVSWDPVDWARFYQYTVEYVSVAPEETSGDCPAKLGVIVPETIIQSASSKLLPLMCLGDYQWKVRACLAENCEEESTGDWSNQGNPWHFALAEEEVPVEEKGGLVPCGRTYNNPQTPWNDREPCEIKHFFFLLENIIDFLLWKLGLIILGILIAATGVIYYFSLGAPATVVNVKAIWKAAGIGYGIIFLGWTIISLLLSILGYQFEFFGHWWEIKF